MVEGRGTAGAGPLCEVDRENERGVGEARTRPFWDLVGRAGRPREKGPEMEESSRGGCWERRSWE